MPIKIKIISTILLLSLLSCNKEQSVSQLEGINFGTAEYYDSFLFVPEKNIPLTKKIKFEFNDWAKDNGAFVELQLLDNNGKIIGSQNSKIKLYANKELCDNGIVKLRPLNNNIVELKFSFLPEAETKEYFGFIVVKDNKIERVNNIDHIKNGSKIYQWNAAFDVVMNPLLKGLIYFLIAIITFLLVWFLLLRNNIYPKIKGRRIMINDPYNSRILKVKGARKVILTSKPVIQKFSDKLFRGKIVYEVNPLWDNELILEPARKRTLRIKTGMHYTIDPYTSSIERGHTYKIKKNSNKETITITYS